MSVKLGLITGRTSRVIAQKQHKEPSFTSQAVSLQKDPRHWPIGVWEGGVFPRRVLQRSRRYPSTISTQDQHGSLSRQPLKKFTCKQIASDFLLATLQRNY